MKVAPDPPIFVQQCLVPRVKIGARRHCAMCYICVAQMLEYLERDADYLVQKAACVFDSETCKHCKLIEADLKEKKCRLVRPAAFYS